MGRFLSCLWFSFGFLPFSCSFPFPLLPFLFMAGRIRLTDHLARWGKDAQIYWPAGAKMIHTIALQGSYGHLASLGAPRP